MSEVVRRAVATAAALWALSAGPTAIRADDWRPPGEPMAIDATALVPLDFETGVLIRGIHGRISVAIIEERELHVVSRALSPRAEELPAGIWQDGNKLIVSTPPGDDGRERQVHVEVPKNFSIGIDARESDVRIEAGTGSVDLRGKNVRAVVTAGPGTLAIDLEGGALTVAGGNDLTARLRGTTAQIVETNGSTIVRTTGGSVTASKLGGSFDAECEDTKLVVDGSEGSIRVKAHKGEATLAGFNAGAELKLSETALHLREGKGDVSVTTDASIDFQAMNAALHLDMYGGSLKGKGNQGILEVRTRNSEINVESVAQGMRIQGDGVRAHVEDVGGELYVETSISDIVLDRVGTVILRIDRGTVSVQRAAGPVTANITGAEVKIIDGIGPVTLEMDRGDAFVSWASLSGDKDSRLTNAGGSITARFAVSGSCRVEAKSKYGRIDSDLPTVKVMDDQSEAQGPVNGGHRPVVHITASGDIHLQNGGVEREEP